ncbi:LysR family transcriptional regulator [Tepidicaulis marinus]|uniref:LysR family transcriptional regulator n=1 Tax=Tepidicaulis marinus TaxID=1333998 RepID=A0A081B8I1_9HYPH|nr:LysR family transcriptional regulator [Tepidicaulis marinus]GAK44349.1 LysR family transcriptional regulator [Tepidicaulis marinus]
MNELNFHHLRYFWAVAHDGNLTRTAERLNVSQSALSIQIKQLEERLGHALFERRGRQLALTEAGRLALDHADAIFSAGEELLANLRASGRSRQALRVGALATLSRNFQIAFLKPVLGRSDVEVILRSGTAAELLRGLEALNLDVVLLTQPPARDAITPFVSHRLAQQRISLVGRAELVGRRSKGKLRELLASEPVLLPTADSSVRTDFNALMERWNIQPQIAAEVDDMAMLRLLTREGVGLGVIPPIVVKDELASGFLKEAGSLPGIAENFYAVTMERKFPNPLVRDLVSAKLSQI